MEFIAEGLWQTKLGVYPSAAKLFHEHWNNFDPKSELRINLMEWIDECSAERQQWEEAGVCYGVDGRSALNYPEFYENERRKKRIRLFEPALEAFKMVNNYDEVTWVSRPYSLNPSMEFERINVSKKRIFDWMVV